MTTRSLTDIFLLMRHRAQQSHQFESRHRRWRNRGVRGANRPHASAEISDTTPLTAFVDADCENDESDEQYEYGDETDAAIHRRRTRQLPSCLARSAPGWLPLVEAVQLLGRQIDEQLQLLAQVRREQLSRPTLDDALADQEQLRAEQLTEAVGQQLRDSHRQLQQLRRAVSSGSDSSVGSRSAGLLGGAVVQALAARLQQLSAGFSSLQTDYLREHQRRERRTQSYFDALIYQQTEAASSNSAANAAGFEMNNLTSGAALSGAGIFGGDKASQQPQQEEDELSLDDLRFLMSRPSAAPSTSTSKPSTTLSLADANDNAAAADEAAGENNSVGCSDQQLQQIYDDSRQLRQRDRHSQQLLGSLAQLNAVFQQLSQLVAEQGGMVDRIDVAVEAARSQVGQGLQQLRQADSHQRSARRRQMALAAVVVAVVLLLLLIVSSAVWS